MTYGQFKSEYENLFSRMMKYNCEQVGSGFYAEKMAALCDDYPEFELQIDEEHNNTNLS